MKNECEVIKDLLPGYIAGILSNDTEEAVNEHIDNCENCKKMLDRMKSSLPNIPNDSDEKVEIDYLKKHNKKMRILKNLILFIILFVVLFSFGIIIKYNYISSIMQKVSNNIKKIEKQNNYVVTITEHGIDYEREKDYSYITKYYYKDDKYKTEKHSIANFDIINGNTYNYGEIDSNSQITIVDDTKTVYKENRNYVYMKKEYLLRDLKNAIQIFDTNFGLVGNLYMKSNYQIRNDRYNGKECYVFKSDCSEYYFEYWIEKDSMMLIRTVQDIYNRIYTENTYELTRDIVKDEDVSIPDLDGYTIKETNENTSDEWLEIYNNVF